MNKADMQKAAGAVCGAAAVAVLYAFIGCPIRFVTGLPCPGCGMTRAALALARLDFAGAFFMHPLIFLTVPVLAAIIIIWLRDKKMQIIVKHKKALSFFFCGNFLAVYAVRMVMYFPDVYPMAFDSNALLIRLIRFFASRM
ncbi:MAG: DUF2752 domain-containing protein [Defluviitaleaceae bacterium]|nr:DUF2752 domain-containing protein [Defluviitaleaceae bacterium]